MLQGPLTGDSTGMVSTRNQKPLLGAARHGDGLRTNLDEAWGSSRDAPVRRTCTVSVSPLGSSLVFAVYGLVLEASALLSLISHLLRPRIGPGSDEG